MRALNKQDGRDLIVLLVTLVVMTVILRVLVWQLVHYSLDIQTGMIISSLGLLLIRHYRLRARFTRRIRAIWLRVSPRHRAA